MGSLLPKLVMYPKVCAAADVRYVGIADELRVVERVEGLDPNLELALTVDLEAAKDACVDIGDARSAEFVAAGVAEVRRDDAGGRLRRRCRWVRPGWRRRWDRTRACRQRRRCCPAVRLWPPS